MPGRGNRSTRNDSLGRPAAEPPQGIPGVMNAEEMQPRGTTSSSEPNQRHQSLGLERGANVTNGQRHAPGSSHHHSWTVVR
jgi:hypothetical protein